MDAPNEKKKRKKEETFFNSSENFSLGGRTILLTIHKSWVLNLSKFFPCLPPQLLKSTVTKTVKPIVTHEQASKLAQTCLTHLRLISTCDLKRHSPIL